MRCSRQLKHWIAVAVAASAMGTLFLSCQVQQTSDQTKELSADVRLISRIGRATSRYRSALDLAGEARTAVERTLADRHWRINRDILKLELEQAKLEVDDLIVPKGNDEGSTPKPGRDVRPQREKAMAEAEKLRADLPKLQQRLAVAEQKKQLARSNREAEQADTELTRARQSLEISQKELALVESNLKLGEIQQRDSEETPDEAKSLSEKILLLEKETLGKEETDVSIFKSADQTSAPGGGLMGSFRSWWNLYDRGQVLDRAEQRANRMMDDFKQAQSQNQKLRKRLRDENRALNTEIRSLYGQAADLLKQPGQNEKSAALISDANAKLATSLSSTERRQRLSRLRDIFEQKVLLATEDQERLANWSQVVSDNRARSLNRLLSRLGSLFGMILIVFLIAHFAKKIPSRVVKEEKSAYYFRKLISFVAWLTVLLMLIFNAAGGIGSISAMIGLAGAGLAIALQDPIVSLVGWFLIIGKYGISVGDRIEINGVKGDVADVGMLRIAVMELGNWLSGEQATGRMVFFPNSFIFKGHFFNYSTSNSFVWDELHILVTYESPWKKAREIILKVAQEASREVAERARESQEKLAKRFNISLGNPEPYIYISIADSGVDLVVRFLSEIKLRRVMRDRICGEILEAFDKEKDIQLAYPTQRQLTEARIINATAGGK